MSKFVFRLQAVLDLKYQLENNAKNDLAAASRVLEQEKSSLNDLVNENDSVIAEYNSEVQKAGITIHTLKEYNSYFSLMKNKILRQKEAVNNAQKIVDIKMEALVKAVQERKILEKLKDKKFREYQQEQLKSEQKLIDEYNSYKYRDTPGEENA